MHYDTILGDFLPEKKWVKPIEPLNVDVSPEKIKFDPLSAKNVTEKMAEDEENSNIGLPQGIGQNYSLEPIHEYKLIGKKVYFTHFKGPTDEYVMMTNLIKETKAAGTIVLNQQEVDEFWKSHWDKGLSEGTMSVDQFNTHYKSLCVEVGQLDQNGMIIPGTLGIGDVDFKDQHMKIIREE